MSKIIVATVEYRVVVKTPEYVLPDEILSRLNGDIALDMPNARILDVEPSLLRFKVVSDAEDGP